MLIETIHIEAKLHLMLGNIYFEEYDISEDKSSLSNSEEQINHIENLIEKLDIKTKYIFIFFLKFKIY